MCLCCVCLAPVSGLARTVSLTSAFYHVNISTPKHLKATTTTNLHSHGTTHNTSHNSGPATASPPIPQHRTRHPRVCPPIQSSKARWAERRITHLLQASFFHQSALTSSAVKPNSEAASSASHAAPTSSISLRSDVSSLSTSRSCLWSRSVRSAAHSAEFASAPPQKTPSDRASVLQGGLQLVNPT